MTSFRPADGDPLFERGMPCNVEAERSILGAILLDNSVCDQASAKLHTGVFWIKTNEWIFDCMVELRNQGLPIDLITLTDQLRRREKFDKIGGATYIGSLIDGVPRTDTIAHYIKLVRNKYRLRELIKVGAQIQALAFDEELETDEIVAEAEGLVFRIGEEGRAGDGEPEHVADIAARVADFYEAKALDPSKLYGLDTGYIDINKLTLGLPEGLNIIAGRPSMGKTSLAMNIACNIANRGGSVFMSSIDSSAEQIVQRILASESKIDSYKMRQGRMTKEEWDRLNTTVAQLIATRFVIDDTTAPSPEEILSKARRFKSKNGLDLLIVDHMQIMARRLMARRRYRDIRTAVMEVGSELTSIGRALHVPILGLSQLNREVDTRADHRPQMSDLAESGTLEGDAETIILLFREEYYNLTAENHGIATLIFGKQKDGARDEIQMAFADKYTRFEDLKEQPPKREPAPPREKARYTGPRYARRDRDD